MFSIIADALMHATGQNPDIKARTRAEIARRAREDRRRADTEFLRRYADRHF